MDFNDTQEEAAFRAEARAFLAANAPPRSEGEPPAFGIDTGPEELRRAKAWQAKKADAGFAGITWPKEYGGREAPPILQVIYQQEEAKFAVPTGVFDIGLGMCLPTMLAYAGPEQLRRLVPKALRGEEIWCQLFSEPAGGSDLAALRTRAERDGDDWVINGQKIWTSGAHYSDYAILITRTDPTVPKHQGLTMFFLSMKSPGVEIRPIHQMSGARDFNEVFFTDVRIPDAQRLGAVNGGWKVSLTTLMNERLTASSLAFGPQVADLMTLARTVAVNGGPAVRDGAVRGRLAEWYVREQGLRLSVFRTLTALSKGKDPGPENSIGKLVAAGMGQDIAAYGMDLMGAAGVVSDPTIAPLQALFERALLYAPSGRIAGGSDEIMRNIIAERVLGMPPDVRVDKDKPFNQVPTGRA